MNAAAEQTTGTAGADERIVAALLDKGRLKEADLGRARRLQEETGGSLLALLGRLGLVSERDHAETCAAVLGLPLASAKDMPELPPEGVALGLRFMTQFHVVPVAEGDSVVDVLAADPQDPYALDAVRLASGKDVRASVAIRSEISDLIERWHGQGRSAMGAIVETAEGEGGDMDDVEHLRDLASEAPVIRLVNLVIQRAVELRASDIHVERRTASSWSPAPPARARPPLTSPMRCARSSGRTRTSSWSARSATWRPPRSRCRLR